MYASDSIGKTDAELFPASFASEKRANDLLVLEQGQAKEFIETTPHPDGERTWLAVKFPVIDADGRSLLGGKAIDITQMKRAEKDIVTFLDNLLINAEATPPGGHLTLCLRQSRSWKNHGELGVRFTIADSGYGIHKVYLSRVFDPFFTTKGEQGNGLGLWVVKGIVEKHGGSIKIRSTDATPKRGTVISIFWPKNARTRKLMASEHAA